MTLQKILFDLKLNIQETKYRKIIIWMEQNIFWCYITRRRRHQKVYTNKHRCQTNVCNPWRRKLFKPKGNTISTEKLLRARFKRGWCIMYDKDYLEYRLSSLQYFCLYSDIRCIFEIKLKCNLAKRENIWKLQTIKVCSHFHSFHVAFRF